MPKHTIWWKINTLCWIKTNAQVVDLWDPINVAKVYEIVIIVWLLVGTAGFFPLVLAPYSSSSSAESCLVFFITSMVLLLTFSTSILPSAIVIRLYCYCSSQWIWINWFSSLDCFMLIMEHNVAIPYRMSVWALFSNRMDGGRWMPPYHFWNFIIRRRAFVVNKCPIAPPPYQIQISIEQHDF